MKILPASSIHFGHIALLLALVLLGGCTDIRELLLERKRERFWEQYQALDECQQLKVVQGYLSNGRARDYVLDTDWPTNDIMLSMVLQMSQRTGISRNIMITCWGSSYGSDEIWLELIEPWQGLMGCNGAVANKLELLRWCDPLLAEAYDSVVQLSSNRLGGSPQVRWGALNMWEAYRIADSVPGAPRPDPDFFGADGSRTCMGLLPADPASPHLASFCKLDDRLIVVKLVSAPDAAGGNNPGAAGLASVAGADSLVFLLRLNSDGTRTAITAPYPASPTMDGK